MDALGWSIIGDQTAFRVESNDEHADGIGGSTPVNETPLNSNSDSVQPLPSQQAFGIYLTDLASLYSEQLSAAQIQKRCQVGVAMI